MDFSWRIFLIVIALNISEFGILLWAQALDKSLPPRHSLIPGTNQKFLYVQDFWTMTLGDLAGVPFILNAFAHLVVKDAATLWLALPVMVASAVVFVGICLRQNHKPDYGFPETGRISLAGRLHLLYFGLGVGASVTCLWKIWTGELAGPLLHTTLGGAAIYAAALVAEIKSGNFDLRKELR